MGPTYVLTGVVSFLLMAVVWAPIAATHEKKVEFLLYAVVVALLAIALRPEPKGSA